MRILQTNKLPEWSSDDAKALRDFLTSSVGLRAVAHMMSEEPELLDGADVNKTLVRTGEVKGFNKASEAFFKLTYEQPPVEKTVTEYPDLDDDKAWTPAPSPEPTNQ